MWNVASNTNLKIPGSSQIVPSCTETISPLMVICAGDGLDTAVIALDNVQLHTRSHGGLMGALFSIYN